MANTERRSGLIKIIRNNLFEVLIALVIVFIILYCLVKMTFLVKGSLLAASAIFYLLCFLLTDIFLKVQGVGNERYPVAVASMLAGIWLFEAVYHYAFFAAGGLTLSVIAKDLTNLTLATPPAGYSFPLVWLFLILSLPFAAYRYMKFNIGLVAIVAVSLLAVLIWVYAGYPQFTNPQWFPLITPAIGLIPLQYAHTSNSAIVFWGYVLNSFAKILCIVPAFLFYKGFKPGRERVGERHTKKQQPEFLSKN